MSIFDRLMQHVGGPVLSTYLGRSGANAVRRRFRGDPDSEQPVNGCIVLRDNADVARISGDSGWISNSQGEEFIELAGLEVPIGVDVDERDEWVFDDQIWKQVGGPNGRDAAYQTLLVENITRSSTGAAKSRKL